ncbi:hypothetical protein MKX03_008275 [Papaver bracteatum]|nr:hypothetical protein MKX03_008275 [Papaver bracteatum]
MWGLDMKTYILLYIALTEDFIFLAPMWESPPKPFHDMPHNYHENVSMENLCKLHVWGIRESPRRVFDAVLFSNEVDLLQFVLLESNSMFTGSLVFTSHRDEIKFIEDRLTYGTEAYQRVALGQLLRVTWIMDDELLMMSDVDEIPSRRTINLFRCCGDIPPILHHHLNNYLYLFEFLGNNKSWRASFMYIRQTILSDVGWHCSFCFRSISEFIFKMKAYIHFDRVRFSDYLNPKRVQDIGKLGPIPHSYTTVHLPIHFL